MQLVIRDVAGGAEVHRVDHLVVPVVFVSVTVLCLSTMACTCGVSECSKTNPSTPPAFPRAF